MPIIPSISTLFLITFNLIYVCGLPQSPPPSSWLADSGRFLKYLWDDCAMLKNNDTARKTTYDTHYRQLLSPSAIECLKRKSLLALDRALDADVIPLVDNIDMVRYDQLLGNRGNPIRSTSSPEENTNDNIVSEKNSNVTITDWKTSVIIRLADVFRTHVVKINFQRNDISEYRSSSDYFSARRRRHRHMMPIFMFGTIAMGMLLIPMGFKFLAVLGGKALLLAKMALLLASIQGLKRIATSSVNYGLYSQYPGWHDRHGRVELLNTSPYVYDTEPVFDRAQQGGAHQADVQMTLG